MELSLNEPEMPYFADRTREDLLADFDRLLSQETPGKRVLIIYGMFGIGKTTLLEMLQLHCKKKSILVAYPRPDSVRPISSTVVRVLSKWYEEMESDIHWDNLKEALGKYLKGRLDWVKQREKETKNPSMSKKIQEGVQLLSAIADVPISATMGFTILPIIKTFFQMREIVRSELPESEQDVLLGLDDILTNAFKRDINSYVENHRAENCRVVLILDDIDKNLLLPWLKYFEEGLHKNILLVAATEKFLDPDEFKEKSIVKPMDLMSDDAMRVLVNRLYSYKVGQAQVLDQDQVNAIVATARGIPFIASTIINLWEQEHYNEVHLRDIQADAFQEFVENLLGSVKMRQIFEVIAIVRVFNPRTDYDKNVLQQLADEQQIMDAAKEIASEDEIITYSDALDRVYLGLRNHPVFDRKTQWSELRKLIDRVVRKNHIEYYRELHRRAFNYYDRRISEADNDTKMEWDYHNVFKNTSEFDAMKGGFSAAEKQARLRQVSLLRDLLRKINEYPLQHPMNCAWRDYYNARLLQLERQDREAELMYDDLYARARDIDRSLFAQILMRRAEFLIRPHRLTERRGVDKAQERIREYKSVIPEDEQDQCWLLFSQAHIDQHQAKWSDAQVALSEALRLCQTQDPCDYYRMMSSYCLLRAGYAYQGEWKPLLEEHNIVRNTFSSAKVDDLIKARILIDWKLAWVWMGRYAEAEKELEEGFAIEKHNKRERQRLRDLFLVFGMQRRCREAIEKLEEAEKWHKDKDKDGPGNLMYIYGFLGMVLLVNREIEESYVYLKQAYDLASWYKPDEQICWKYWMGVNLLAEGSRAKQNGLQFLADSPYTQAERYFEECLGERDKGRHYFICGAHTGLVYVMYERGHDLEDEKYASHLKEAESLAREYEYNDHLAYLRLTQGHSAWGKEQFTRALHFYKEALVYALRFNRFLLDDVIGGDTGVTPWLSIIDKARTRQDGRQMLEELKDWWQVASNDFVEQSPDSISFVKDNEKVISAEKVAREREKGDPDLPQRAVMKRIEDAFS